MSLDENVIGEVLQMLAASQEMNPETQSEVFSDIQSFKSLDQINLYLLEAIGNEELPDVSRCVAAILMRHYFIACEDKNIKETFKNNAFQVLSPFFNLPPSPLTNCVSALFAELLKYFGSDVFPNIAEIITDLADMITQAQNGETVTEPGTKPSDDILDTLPASASENDTAKNTETTSTNE